MNPRRLYRWKSFWLGVFVLCSLEWAWIRSLSYYSYFDMRWIGLGLGIGFGQERGEIELVAIRETESSRVFFMDGPLGTNDVWLAPPFTHKVYTEDNHFWFAHWLLILLFMLAWGSWLAWRLRQLRMYEVTVGEIQKLEAQRIRQDAEQASASNGG